MNATYYDVESLQNVFSLCNYKEKENTLDIYLLCDNRELYQYSEFLSQLAEKIYEKNRNFNGQIVFFDLSTPQANEHMAMTFGVSDAYLVNDPTCSNTFPVWFRPVCDTDHNYNENEHPYIFSYHGYDYDSTMLAIYFNQTYPNMKNMPTGTFVPVSAQFMRAYNDVLFGRFKTNMPELLLYAYDGEKKQWSNRPNYNDRRNRIRKNMLLSGRHIDVARLNEKQSKISLKRILGMFGYQILESDKLRKKSHIDTTEELLELIAYNVSDVINMKELMRHEFYQAQFQLKKEQLKKYPELIYEKQQDAYEPDVNPAKVRRDRLTIDSSSAQFSAKLLCPYGHLTDIPTVSFMYPSESKAKELGIERINVLEETKKFFYEKFPQPDIRAKFDNIYKYYKSIEGKNFNASKNYADDYGGTTLYQDPISLNSLPKPVLGIPYYNADGTPSRAFVNFSIGGIHGAEYNKQLYDKDMLAYDQDIADMEYVKSQYPSALDLKNTDMKMIAFPDGRTRPVKEFLTAKSTQIRAEYRDFTKNEPKLFLIDTKGTKLNPKYTFTSSDPSTHEDFKAYYPVLLMMLSAFYNDNLGYDRYAEMFNNREKYSVLMKDMSLSEEERNIYAILREGAKLILNSASGTADANYESNIRMNNMIISMRIIGQLFSYRIGQAQTYEGAKITSTNTDGLYSVMDSELNNQILEKEAKNIGVQIEPEPVWLISKDSNNRIEIELQKDENGKFVVMGSKVMGTSGGTVGCRKGPVPTKALSQPAIIDWALTEYLIVAAREYKGLSLDGDFNDEIGRNILRSAEKKFEPVQWLKMFQNVLASSEGSINYIFGTRDGDDAPIIMQLYNRVFIMKDNTPGTLHLQAVNARKITENTIRKRKKNNERTRQHDPYALNILDDYGVSEAEIPSENEAVIKKINNIEETWYMYVLNNDLYRMSDEEIAYIMENIDYEKYLSLLRNCYEKNWRNNVPMSSNTLPDTVDAQMESIVEDIIVSDQEAKEENKINTVSLTAEQMAAMMDYINATLQTADVAMVQDVYAYCKGEINFL